MTSGGAPSINRTAYDAGGKKVDVAGRLRDAAAVLERVVRALGYLRIFRARDEILEIARELDGFAASCRHEDRDASSSGEPGPPFFDVTL
jgi:hypothetical protein